MHFARWTPFWAGPLALIVVVSSLAVMGGPSGAVASAVPTRDAGPLSGVSSPTLSNPAAGESAAAPPTRSDPQVIPTVPSEFASEAIAAAKAAGIPSKFVFVPRPMATPEQEQAAEVQGHISPPACGACPGPMGIGDFGLRNLTNGTMQPYALNTTSLEATLSLGANGIQPLYVLDSDPNAYSVQLNAALTNVTLLGNDSFQFWTQNVAVYDAHSAQLDLVSNVWNFSSNFFSNNSIVNHGPDGRVTNGKFYEANVTLTDVSAPFNLTLFLNSTTLTGNDAVDFSDVLVTASGTHSYPFDFVEFNSTRVGGIPVSGPAGYSANGFTYNPVGLPDDFEFVLGGPGGGSQVNLLESDATMSLRYASAAGPYLVVPSALSYGGDAGESASGTNIEWTSGAAGPYAVVSTGPSILTGLWNASGLPGVATILATVLPTDAFVFLQPASAPFTVSQPEWSPTALDSLISVSPGSYTVEALMSYYDGVSQPFPNLAPGTEYPFIEDLTFNSALGVTTPIWAWNDSQLAEISSGGLGTNASPYMIDDQQNSPMSPMFGTMNDYRFPVFSGVFFAFTNRSAEVYEPGPFSTYLPTPFVEAGYPTTNDLSFTFYDASNVSVVGAANISGWFSSGLYYHPTNPSDAVYSYATYNMVFWNSSHNLVARNNFQTESNGIYLYGGTDNTIWNNTIRWIATPNTTRSDLWPRQLSVGIQEGESGDLIYNNAIYTETTALTPKFDLYTGAPAIYLDRWNITETSNLSEVNHATDFPDYPLSGTIAPNGTYQGGNFWWDYGQPDNPFFPGGAGAYTAHGGITNGGDHWPLTEVFNLTFHAFNYTGTANWTVNLTDYLNQGFSPAESSRSNVTFAMLPDSLYNFSVSVVPRYAWVVSWAITLPFPLFQSMVIPLLFTSVINGTLVGTVQPASAHVLVDGNRVNVVAGAFNVSLTPGNYTVIGVANGFHPSISYNVSITSNNTTVWPIVLAPWYGWINGTVTPASASPVLAIGGVLVTVSSSTGYNQSEAQGTYMVEASAVGYTTNSTEVNVTANKTTYLNLTLTPSVGHSGGLSALDWELVGIIGAVVIVVLAVVLIRAQKGRPPPTGPPSAALPTSPSEASNPPADVPPPASGGS
jgi:thermopsin